MNRVWQSAAREQESCVPRLSCVEFSESQLASMYRGVTVLSLPPTAVTFGEDVTEMTVGRLNKKRDKIHLDCYVLTCGMGKGQGVLCLPAGPTGIFDFEKMNDSMQLRFVHLCMSHFNLKVYKKN